MAIQKIETNKAPAAIGPYSQGVRVGDLFFFSGQIPLDPQSGELVAGGITEQAERVLANMKAVLEGAGLGFENVVKTTMFLTDLANFATANEIYGRHFSGVFPARSTIQVSALPKGSQIEIEMIATAK